MKLLVKPSFILRIISTTVKSLLQVVFLWNILYSKIYTICNEVYTMFTNSKRKNNTLIILIIISVCFLLEMFIFNNHLYFETKHKSKKILPLSQATINGNGYYNDSLGIVIPVNKSIAIQFENCNVKALSLTIYTEPTNPGCIIILIPILQHMIFSWESSNNT